MNYKTIEKFPFLNTLVNIQLDRIVGRKKVKTIIDVGAYNGSYCLYMAMQYSNAKIHAIEPAHKAFKLLKRISTKFSNITAYRLLISNKDGKEVLFVENLHERVSQSSSVFKDFVDKKKGKSSEENVKAVTLYSFCQSNNIADIDLLVINCEGGEYKIFEHESSLSVLEKVKILNIALHGKSKLFNSKRYMQKKKQINRFLMDMGFELVYGDNLNEICKLPRCHIQQVWVKE